ncbi:MAG: hypothetical protein ACK4IX_16440 [Candidatus Sericytochromatia bacterium]
MGITFTGIFEHDLDEVYVKKLPLHTGYMNDYRHIDFELIEEYDIFISNNRNTSLTALNQEEINLIDKNLTYEYNGFVLSLKCGVLDYSRIDLNKRRFFFFRDNLEKRNLIRTNFFNELVKICKNPRAIYYDDIDDGFIDKMFVENKNFDEIIHNIELTISDDEMKEQEKLIGKRKNRILDMEQAISLETDFNYIDYRYVYDDFSDFK